MTKEHPTSVPDRLRYLEGKTDSLQYLLSLVVAQLADPERLTIAARVTASLPDPDEFYTRGYKDAAAQISEEASQLLER